MFARQFGLLAYNRFVPTPFYHLSVAEELLRQVVLPASIQHFLFQHKGAFLLGNTAPDVQVISGQPRASTHFFDLPIRPGDRPAWVRCLSDYPSLANKPEQTDARLAFITGYLCHLQADWFWIKEIFVPAFGLQARWGAFPQRLYLHNVLRAYLDREIIPALRNGTNTHLQATKPINWLPFVEDGFLRQWRDFLSGQLQPGARTLTVDVFARRQGVDPQEFQGLLESEERMEIEIFHRIPRSRVESYRQKLVESNLQLIQSYLGKI